MNTWQTIGLLAVIVLALWYVFGRQVPPTAPSTTGSQVEAPALSTGNTTTDISNDLTQTPDLSDALNSDSAASAQSVEGL